MPPIPKDILAAAVAHGISPRVVGTWHPDLPRTPRVLVPIQVDALVVRDSGRTFADCRMRAPTAADPDPAPAGSLLPPPFADEPQPRAPGVHLHWALPDGLAHGSASSDGSSVTFPSIPDRWLVLRLSSGGSLSRRAVRGWMLESGSAEPKVTPLDQWTEPGSNAPDVQRPLTALGHGDPAWAGYYANVVDRLAFHDDLSDAARGPLAYLVCGWHFDVTHDPIGEGLPTLDAFQQRLHALRWELAPGELDLAMREANAGITAATRAGLATREARFADVHAERQASQARLGSEAIGRFSEATVTERALVDHAGLPVAGRYVAADRWWPQHTLYHGAVVGLGWPTTAGPGGKRGLLGGEVGGPPDPAGITVVVANTMPEALGTLVARNNGTDRDGRLVEAALLGAVDELDEPDGTARLDVRLHTAGFGALSAGATTEVVSQRPPAGPARAHVPDPAAVDKGIFRQASVATAATSTVGTRAPSDVTLGIASGAAATARAAAKHVEGTLHDALAAIALNGPDAIAGGAAAAPANDQPAENVEVSRTLPRRYVPPDPVLLVEGAQRSFKHGNDGVHSESGRLVCRITAHTVRHIMPARIADAVDAAPIGGADLLERGAENGSVPPECDDLLRELALLDPGSAEPAARTLVRGRSRLSASQLNDFASVIATEQMAWWMSRDPRRDLAPLAARSGIAGVLPSPRAISPPVTPWVPLHLDWEAEYIPSPAAIRDWALREVDFDAEPGSVPDSGSATGARLISGRALLTGGAARTAAAAVRRTMEQAQRAGGSTRLAPGTLVRFHSRMSQVLLGHFDGMRVERNDGDDGELSHVVDELEQLDVLAGALDNFHTALRGGLIGDGHEAPAVGSPAPDPFTGLRAGYLRFRRLRLVDCFGQTVYLAGSAVDTPVDMTRIVPSEPLTVQGRTDLVELAPRFTSPARLWFRFVDAGDDSADATAERSPLCGFVLPNHLDGALQVYGADGGGIGAVRPEAGSGVVWEDAPGQPTTVGKSPLNAIENPHLAQMAQALLDWGVADTTPGAPATETALSALLRIVDTTLWSVDPFAHAGDEHLSLLVAHPVAVMRARLRLEVQEPVPDATVRGVRVPVRIGAPASWQDGLLAYFVNDDYRTLCVADPACAQFARPIGPNEGFLQQATATSDYYQHFADDIGVSAVEGNTPVDHAYVDTEGVVWVQPDQDVWLTLLVEPHSVVHATSGLLPRKDIGMRREWVAPGLARLAPFFRFGPVMLDPKRIRMPVASDIRGTWSWSHRVDPTTWADEPVVNAAGDAQIPPDPCVAQEGWLKLNPPTE